MNLSFFKNNIHFTRKGASLLWVAIPFWFMGCGDETPEALDVNYELSISTESISIPENGGTASIKVFLNQENITGSDFSFVYELRGSATQGTDYKELSGTISIPIGAKEDSILIEVIDDEIFEGDDETIIVQLTKEDRPPIVSISETVNNVTITILEDEPDPRDDGLGIGDEDCPNDNTIDSETSDCAQMLTGTEVTFSESFGVLTIEANNVPDHLFNAPLDQIKTDGNFIYTTDFTPAQPTGNKTELLGSNGPVYLFGVALNGVRMDPVAAEPFADTSTGELNWSWVKEVTNNASELKVDCNFGHLQPDGTYHYHGDMIEYANNLGIDGSEMIQVGWAADGHRVYYKYAFDEMGVSIVELSPSYSLKEGNRLGDGVSAPCGSHSGKYVQDYEYVEGLGDLDECNGRTGKTPYADSEYYYVITNGFPVIPRCFMGTPDDSFLINP